VELKEPEERGVAEAVPVAAAVGEPDSVLVAEGDAPGERLAVGLTALADADEVAVPVGVPVPDVEAVGVADPLGVPELEGVPLLLPLLLGVPERLAP
jgi:hypothetical protein